MENQLLVLVQGLVVKAIVSAYKTYAMTLDQGSLTQTQINFIHGLVFVASTLVTLGTDVLDHQASGFDIATTVNVVLVYLAAVATNEIGKLVVNNTKITPVPPTPPAKT